MEDGKRYARKVPRKDHRDGRKGGTGGPELHHRHIEKPLTYAGRGFTFAELMIVLLVVGLALAVTVPVGVQWAEDYKFSAASRAFINAAQLVRIKSVGGQITINVSQVNKGMDDSQVVFTVPAFTASTSVTDSCVAPLAAGDYITVGGINNPDTLNGQIFLITNVASPWSVTKVAAGSDNVCNWNAVTVTAKSCMENDTSNCVKWPADVTAPQATTTGLIRVASCLRFVPFAHNDKDRVHFTVVRSGNSMQCRYDPQWMDVKVVVPDSSDPKKSVQIYDVAGTDPAPIVFDYAGSTRNQITYTVEMRKMTRTQSGSTLTYTPVDDKKSPPIVFSILPAGRIRLGNVPQTYGDTK
ncbi:MAG: prepilin-type N-terminal cleavage/methylation domain-containing protein [Pseudomonadota bacterium]